MKTILDQQYSGDLAEKCRRALEANFGEIPLPKCFSNRKGNVKVEPVYIIEVIHRTKLMNKKSSNKNKKEEKRNLVIKIKTQIKLWKI